MSSGKVENLLIHETFFTVFDVKVDLATPKNSKKDRGEKIWIKTSFSSTSGSPPKKHPNTPSEY